MHQAVHRSHSNYFGVLHVEIFARGGKQIVQNLLSVSSGCLSPLSLAQGEGCSWQAIQN